MLRGFGKCVILYVPLTPVSGCAGWDFTLSGIGVAARYAVSGPFLFIGKEPIKLCDSCSTGAVMFLDKNFAA